MMVKRPQLAIPDAGGTSPSSSESTQSTPQKYLLSFDGGGVRGLSALLIMKYIMKQVNHQRDQEQQRSHLLRRQRHDYLELKPCDIFDLMAGTSTGGLIAIMLGRLQMDVESCLETYLEFIPRVFVPRSVQGPPLSILFNIKPRYDSKKLKEFIDETVKKREHNGADPGAPPNPAEVPLRASEDPHCKVFVCATQSANSKISLLRSYNAPFSAASVEPTITQAALATTAAPSFFGEAKIPIVGSHKYMRYVDGALNANNPVRILGEEAGRIWEENTAGVIHHSRVACFLSIGTGVPKTQEVRSSLKGFMETLSKIATETEETARSFEMEWKADTYYRFNVEQGLQQTAIDEKDAEGDILAVTSSYAEHSRASESIRECARILMRRPLNPRGIVYLIESGQDSLVNENLTEAFDKFNQANELVHRRNPDHLDMARFVATNLGIAECLFRTARRMADQKDFGDDMRRNMQETIDGALEHIEFVRAAKNPEEANSSQSIALEKSIKELKSSIDQEWRRIGVAP